MDTTKAPPDRMDPSLCAVCGRERCTVPGLHGMIRDRARAAITGKPAQARRYPAKDMTYQA